MFTKNTCLSNFCDCGACSFPLVASRNNETVVRTVNKMAMDTNNGVGIPALELKIHEISLKLDRVTQVVYSQSHPGSYAQAVSASAQIQKCWKCQCPVSEVHGVPVHKTNFHQLVTRRQHKEYYQMCVVVEMEDETLEQVVAAVEEAAIALNTMPILVVKGAKMVRSVFKDQETARRICMVMRDRSPITVKCAWWSKRYALCEPRRANKSQGQHPGVEPVTELDPPDDSKAQETKAQMTANSRSKPNSTPHDTAEDVDVRATNANSFAALTMDEEEVLAQFEMMPDESKVSPVPQVAGQGPVGKVQNKPSKPTVRPRKRKRVKNSPVRRSTRLQQKKPQKREAAAESTPDSAVEETSETLEESECGKGETPKPEKGDTNRNDEDRMSEDNEVQAQELARVLTQAGESKAPHSPASARQRKESEQKQMSQTDTQGSVTLPQVQHSTGRRKKCNAYDGVMWSCGDKVTVRWTDTQVANFRRWFAVTNDVFPPLNKEVLQRVLDISRLRSKKNLCAREREGLERNATELDQMDTSPTLFWTIVVWCHAHANMSLRAEETALTKNAVNYVAKWLMQHSVTQQQFCGHAPLRCNKYKVEGARVPDMVPQLSAWMQRLPTLQDKVEQQQVTQELKMMLQKLNEFSCETASVATTAKGTRYTFK